MAQMESTDLLLLILYAPGKKGAEEPVDGVTRLQKLVFLLQQDVGPKQLVKQAEAYPYKPHKMGPYSDRLSAEIQDLCSAGILRTRRLVYVLNDDADETGDAATDIEGGRSQERRLESIRFSLTNLGKRIGEDLWQKKLSDEQRSGLTEFKAFFNSLSLRQLLIFTYERFPRFTSESTIKRQLGLT